MLTPKEMLCLSGVARHLQADEIARELGLSPKTVETHLANVRKKLGVSSSRVAVRQVFGDGLKTESVEGFPRYRTTTVTSSLTFSTGEVGMPRTIKRVPEWYTRDWSPATARNEMSAMRWEDLEAAIDTLIVNPDRRHRPKHIIRKLWLQSADMPTMDLLQRILLAMAQSLDPSRSMQLKAGEPIIPTAANGLLPRWSYTDLEVALSYTWSNLALEIAIARHHDCLMFRDDRLTGAATARQLMLLVNGLPTPSASRSTIAAHQHVRSAKAA